MLLRFPTLGWGMDLARVPDTWLVALRLTGLGWYVATCIVVGVLGGIWLDKLLGAKILFFLLGTVLGVIVAFWGLYKLLQPVLTASTNETGRGNHLEDSGENH